MQPVTRPTRVQLCGPFAVELSGRRVDHVLPGRQARLLFAYLVLSRHQRVTRDALVDALWTAEPPAGAGAALSVLSSKVRAVVGPDVVRGRSELTLVLPEPGHIDVETALAALHAAGSADRSCREPSVAHGNCWRLHRCGRPGICC